MLSQSAVIFLAGAICVPFRAYHRDRNLEDGINFEGGETS